MQSVDCTVIRLERRILVQCADARVANVCQERPCRFPITAPGLTDRSELTAWGSFAGHFSLATDQGAAAPDR